MKIPVPPQMLNQTENECSKGGESETKLVVNQSRLNSTRSGLRRYTTELLAWHTGFPADVLLRPSSRGSYEGVTAA